MHVWVTAAGHTALMASGRPARPSQTTTHTSPTPRFLSSVSTRSQYLPLLVFGEWGLVVYVIHERRTTVILLEVTWAG